MIKENRASFLGLRIYMSNATKASPPTGIGLVFSKVFRVPLSGARAFVTLEGD